MAGKALDLFFIDGVPEGMLTAGDLNWTGHILMTPRTRLVEALKRNEAKFTGVYILLGESEDSGQVRAYIGEAENVAERIRNHDSKKDWWTQVVLITSSADVLNKAHVKYIESRLVEEARNAGRMSLENGNTPPRPSLSEAQLANMEQFVEHIFLILPAIRVDGFLVKTRTKKNVAETLVGSPDSTVTIFKLTTLKNKVEGTAHLQNEEFIVQPGSKGRFKWEGTPDHNYKKLFDEVVESGVYVPSGDHRIFTAAYAFPSASAAGAVLNGRATAGPVAWKLASDVSKTYKQWEAEQLINS